MKRRIRITVLRETLAPRGAAGAADAGAAWCPACAAFSPLLTAEEAAALCGVAAAGPRSGGPEAGGVHLVEAGDLAPLVCLRSLLSGVAPRDVGAGDAGGAGAAKVLNFRRDGGSR
ncbi:MAG TPA: hypothetical protein VF538_14360 [Pyrinomonadaceae bacterium]